MVVDSVTRVAAPTALALVVFQFTAAGAIHAFNPRSIADAIALHPWLRFRSLPLRTLRLVGRAFGLTEFTVALGVVLGFITRVPTIALAFASVATVLSAFFVGWVLTAVRSGTGAPCGCDAGSEEANAGSVLRTALTLFSSTYLTALVIDGDVPSIWDAKADVLVIASLSAASFAVLTWQLPKALSTPNGVPAEQ